MTLPGSLSNLATKWHREAGPRAIASGLNRIGASINALEAVLGLNPQGSAASVAARIAAVEASVTPTAGLVPTGVKTANYTATINDFVVANISSGGFTVTLPSAPTDGAQVAVKIVAINANASNTLTVARGGTDVFNVAGGSTSLTLTNLFQSVVLQYKSSTGIWYVRSADTGQIDTPHYVGGTNSLGTTLASPFANVATYQPLFFYKDLSGIVHIEGCIAAIGAAAVANQNIFTLPAGYRPAGGKQQIGAALVGGGNINIYSCVVQTDGQVLVGPAAAQNAIFGFTSAFRTV